MPSLVLALVSRAGQSPNHAAAALVELAGRLPPRLARSVGVSRHRREKNNRLRTQVTPTLRSWAAGGV